MMMGMRTARPVFLDRTGARRRVLVVAGTGGGLALLAVTVAILVGFTGTAPGALPALPVPAEGRAAGVVPAPRADPRVSRPPSRPAVPTSATPSTVAGSATPSATTNPHRTVPTQTPSHRKKK
jgi:hypothetical protein